MGLMLSTFAAVVMVVPAVTAIIGKQLVCMLTGPIPHAPALPEQNPPHPLPRPQTCLPVLLLQVA